MNTHKLFRVGKACVGLGALAAPAPLITCALDGRAGASVLLPVLPLAAGAFLLAAHGTDASRCDGCMSEVAELLEPSAASTPYVGLGDELDAFDLNEAA
jgi:hypothetical protein